MDFDKLRTGFVFPNHFLTALVSCLEAYSLLALVLGHCSATA